MLLRITVYPFLGESIATEPELVLHATAGTARDGAVVVGRKAADIVLAQDKSVSREHCRIRILSSSPLLLEKVPTPRTDEETAACRAAGDHVAVVLENVSRLGCFIVRQKGQSSAASAAAPDSATEDDATDDDEAHRTASSLPVDLSPVTRQLVGDESLVEMQHVTQNQTVVLNELLLDAKEQRVVIQAGKCGSTLVVERMDFGIYFSMSKSVAAQVLTDPQSLLLCGARQVPEVEDASFLAVAARGASLSQLYAWLRKVPIVHTDFVKALQARQHLTDPLPDPADFPPKSDGMAFWDLAPPVRPWRQWTFFNHTQQDAGMEVMLEAAGCDIVRLYELADSPSGMAEVAADRATPHMFGAKGKAGKPAIKAMAAKGIPMYTPKEIASCLIKGKLPNGEPRPEPDELPVDQEARVSPAAEHAEIPASQRSEKVPAEQLPVESQTSRKSRQPEAVAESQASKRSTKSVAQQKDEEMAPPPEDEPMQSDKEPEPPKQKAKVAESPPKKRKKNAATDDHRPEKRLALSNDTSSGWLVAAPKGQKRKAYVRTKAEIQEATGLEKLGEVALTMTSANLLVKKVVPPSAPSRRKTQTGPDFRRFRKNPVPHVPRARIPLRAFTPAETALQRELAEQREMAEAQQRKADELFADPGRTAKRRQAGRR